MSEQRTTPELINEAMNVVDKALKTYGSRELVSGGELTDVLLDVRGLLQDAGVDLTLIEV